MIDGYFTPQDLLTAATCIRRFAAFARDTSRRARKQSREGVSSTERFQKEQRHEVTELARSRFFHAVDLSEFRNAPDEHHTASVETLEARKTVFRAGFVSGSLYVNPTYLVPISGDGWRMIMVYEGTGVKKSYIEECAVISHVLDAVGVEVHVIEVWYVNKQYRRDGALDTEALLSSSNVTRRTARFRRSVEKLTEAMKASLSQDPSVLREQYGMCDRPEVCPVCREEVPQVTRFSVFSLHRSAELSRKLFSSGVSDIRELPDEIELNEKQRIQRDAVLSDRPYVDRSALNVFLDSLQYPVSYLDFEAISKAVPSWSCIRPWQHVPFQYSLHIQRTPDEEPEHRYWISDPADGDVHAELVRHLVRDVPSEGTMLAFSADFERSVIGELARCFPEHAPELRSILERSEDLLAPFRQFAYYHPGQLGKTSMKVVLPLLTGRDYSAFRIRDGREASLLYYFHVLKPHSQARDDRTWTDGDREKLFADLAEYCGLDTYGMVLIVKRLRELCAGDS